MTPGAQLQQIERLTLDDGVAYTDLRAIALWAQLCGPDYDYTVLEERSQARISLIHFRHFELVPGTEDEYRRRKYAKK